MPEVKRVISLLDFALSPQAGNFLCEICLHIYAYIHSVAYFLYREGDKNMCILVYVHIYVCLHIYMYMAF